VDGLDDASEPSSHESCQVCGGVPALEVKIEGHHGMIVVMRAIKAGGVFCKTCGTATVRRSVLSARTR
jgi:hypothetical protein